MAVEIPDKKELKGQILQDIATEFGVDVSELGDTYTVEATVQGGMLWIAYLALSGVQKNIYYDLSEESVLIRYGTIILGRTPAPAESGEYNVEVIGAIGATIPASTQFRANDETKAGGYIFILDQEYTLISETDTITLRSLDPGTDASLFVDDLLTSVSPIVDVNSEVKTTVIAKQPTSAESITSYRSDVLAAARIEPQGGSPGDYRLWSLEEPTVRTTYPFATAGDPNSIDIYIESTVENTAPAEAVGVPTQSTIDSVYKNDNGVESGLVVINPTTGKGRKPIGVFAINALPVQPIAVDVKIIGLSDDSKGSDIRTSIENLLYKIRPFVAGADILVNKNDILTIGAIIAAVIATIGDSEVVYTNLTIDVDGVDVSTYTFTFANYPYLRFITNDGNII